MFNSYELIKIMTQKRAILIFMLIVILMVMSFWFIKNERPKNQAVKKDNSSINDGGLVEKSTHPMMIEYQRLQEYPGSQITLEQELSPGVNYKQYIASYKSEGLKIYGLLTIPTEEHPPAGGWPAIIFNHGYISPDQYSTTEHYVTYVDAFARNGYIVFKPDYRGHGNSEGEPVRHYFSPKYVTDVLNALSSIKRLKDVNPQKIGMWGHSMGGNITMKSLVISKDIKAVVVWAGVVGSYNDILNNWNRRFTREHGDKNSFTSQYGTPETDPSFWQKIDPYSYIKDISAPIQLHHGVTDDHVPVSFSKHFADELKKAGKTVEYYTYKNTDHNLSGNAFDQAMERSINFFNKYLK